MQPSTALQQIPLLFLQGVCRKTANFVLETPICSKKTLLLLQLLQLNNRFAGKYNPEP